VWGGWVVGGRGINDGEEKISEEEGGGGNQS